MDDYSNCSISANINSTLHGFVYPIDYVPCTKDVVCGRTGLPNSLFHSLIERYASDYKRAIDDKAKNAVLYHIYDQLSFIQLERKNGRPSFYVTVAPSVARKKIAKSLRKAWSIQAPKQKDQAYQRQQEQSKECEEEDHVSKKKKYDSDSMKKTKRKYSMAFPNEVATVLTDHAPLQNMLNPLVPQDCHQPCKSKQRKKECVDYCNEVAVQTQSKESHTQSQYDMGMNQLTFVKNLRSAPIELDHKCSLVQQGHLRQLEVIAAEWFRRAATKGHADAQFELGKCFHSGTGVVVDMETAATLYCQAAAQFYCQIHQDLDDPMSQEQVDIFYLPDILETG